MFFSFPVHCGHKRGTKRQILIEKKSTSLQSKVINILSTLYFSYISSGGSWYLLKYCASFEDIFLANESLKNAISLPFNLFHLVQTCGYSCQRPRRPQKDIWNLTIPLQLYSLHPGNGEILTPGKALQIKFPTPRAQKIVKWPAGFPWEGRGGSAHQLWICVSSIQ